MAKMVFVMLLAMFTTTKSLAYNGLLTGDGSNTNPYYIMDRLDWARFTSLLNNPETAPYYCDKHYRLGADIGETGFNNAHMVKTWAATNPAYPFRGTFDGQGHKILIDFTKTSEGVTGDEKTQGVALFQCVSDGCDIHDLIVEGVIRTNYKFAAGIISYIESGTSQEHPNFVFLSRCSSFVVFELGISGDATSGGLVACSKDYVRLTVNDCLFAGAYATDHANCISGIVGYQSSNGYTYIENCYVDPLFLNIPNNNKNRNLCRYDNKDSFKESNCYYSVFTNKFDDDQGEFLSPSHSPESVAYILGYWTVNGDQPIPQTLNLVAENCTLFKGFTVKSYFVRYNTNDNNGDQGVEKLVDGDRSTSWCVRYPYSMNTFWYSVYVEFYSDRKFIPKGYIITTGNQAKENPDSRPKKWQVIAYENLSSLTDNVLDSRDASSSKHKLPESDMTDKTYLLPNYENINTDYQVFQYLVSELWRPMREWDGIFHGKWHDNQEDFVCELGEIQFFGVMSDAETHKMGNCAISGIESYYDYTGNAIELNYLVTDYNNTILVEGTDYTKTMVRKNGINVYNDVTEVKEAGEYTITLTGKDTYNGEKKYSFVVMDSSLPSPMAYTSEGGTAYYYVKIPRSGQTNLNLTDTDPDFTEQFYVFCDNGHNQPYSSNCDGKLLITAPEGYVLQVQGNIQSQGYPNDYFVMYDGDNTNTVLGDAHYGIPNIDQSIPLLYTTGRNLLLYFKSDGTNNPLNGVNLQVTPVPAGGSYNIAIASVDHGQLTTTEATTGLTVNTANTLNVAPSTGYMLQDVSVKTTGGTPVYSDKGLWYTGNNTVTFKMPASDVNVTPTFAAKNALSVNMPVYSYDIAHATNVIIPADVTTFKVYDDGGPDGTYSANCNGMLLLTAPENTVLEFSGTVDVYDDDTYLHIYDGNDFNNDLGMYNRSYSSINKVLSSGNQALLLFASDNEVYDIYSGIDLTVRVININEYFDIAIDNVTGGTVVVQGGATEAKVLDTVKLDVETTDGYVVAQYTMTPDCDIPVSGGVWHESPAEAAFVMPPADITITPTITDDFTAAGGLYINMPTSNRNNPKTVNIQSGITSFKVYDDGGADGNYSMYCDGYLVLKAPLGWRLKLSGTVICNDNGTVHDYLKVYDGDTEHLTPLGKSYGYGKPAGETFGPLITSGRTMVLNFSTANNSMSGLDLLVEVTNEDFPYIINFDNTQAPAGCSIAISGYVSHDNELAPNEYVAHVGSTITIDVTCDDNHLLNSISVTDNDGNDIDLSQGMIWYNGNNNTATFTMPASILTIAYEFVNLGDQYIKLPKQNSIESKFEVTPAAGITSFKIYDDGGQSGNYSNNCDSYTLLTAPKGKAWQLTGTVTTENVNDYLIPYEGDTLTRGIDGTSYGKPSGEDIGTLISINKQVLLEFQSNGSVNYSGLDLTATIVDPVSIVVKGYANPAPPAEDAWMFVAAPMKYDVSPNYVKNVFPLDGNDQPSPTSDEYDLYRFNQSADAEWENYKAHVSDFNFEGGKGYLYARKYADPDTIVFGGSFCGEDVKEVPLAYDATAGFAGWNLVGNPLITTAYIDRPYYQIDDRGNHIEAIDTYSMMPISRCAGVIVCAENANDVVTFSKNKPSQSAGKGSVNITLSKVGARGSETIQDNAIVSFNEGTKLGKFIFNENNARIYIPQDDSDYAIVYSNREGEVPLNFKTKTTGRYTITVETCHGASLQGAQLIDKFENVTVNLNVCNSYTFIGSAADGPDRFSLVFNSDNAGDNFAYQNGSDIIINGEGELQMFDVMGRVVMQLHIDGVETIAKPSQNGVYIMKLNDNIQKIVVE